MLNKIVVAFIILIGTSLAGSSFYWFELRPIPIKKECSWVTDTRISVLGDLGQTQAEADKVNAENKKRFPNGCVDVDSSSLDAVICNSVATARPPREQKMESYIRAASSEEYKECLRHNGLD
jgi:hypothetical protein